MPRCSRAPLFAVVICTACDVPGVTLVRPDVSGGTGASLTIHVALEDSAMAEALGWTDGVPGATVVIHRFIDPFQPETLYTDATGHVTPGDGLPGWHLVAGYRVLSGDQTGPTAGVVRAFGDGLKLKLPGQDTVRLRLRIDQPGSLVMSEVFTGGGTLELAGYGWAQFYELYNNSDTTVHLDRMLLGIAVGRLGAGVTTCEERQSLRENPLGLWAWFFHQFPGSGRDHPVSPGETVTIALDAVDHSHAHTSLPDLSRADFELEGTGDTDNPDVPNMPEVGPRAHPSGHGMISSNTSVVFIALPGDPGSLETTTAGSHTFQRVPREHILDVMHGDWVSATSEPPIVYDEQCNWVNREFDRLAVAYYRPGGDNRISVQRRVLEEVDQRLVLQDVDASFVDWVLGVYSPGRIQY